MTTKLLTTDSTENYTFPCTSLMAPSTSVLTLDVWKIFKSLRMYEIKLFDILIWNTSLTFDSSTVTCYMACSYLANPTQLFTTSLPVVFY